MTYTAKKLITKAYYLSGIASRTLQTVTADQLSEGLDLLNGLLAAKTAHQRLIPYFEEYSFPAVIGQEKYFIPGLIAVDTFVFYIGSVRFSMLELQRRDYFGSPRVDNVQSLPYNWHIERTIGGSNLFIYFVPNTNYPLRIVGKFGLDSITDENVDLSTIYDQYYIEYLRYALAEYICADNNITFQPQSQQKLNELEKILTDISPMDLSIKKMSTLTTTSDRCDIYLDANIAKGWRP
jgi:hypothetical protein